ncbi:hypothetical protein PPL_04370 [Heterostelium album PN500]|uniref:Uncharacterized protein n=1 Tax=Heterostelium pallidum (strain ATCC 26659 / Pp 5 / PN500) TaxID=670386 RepID=D3B7D3_HETP5|nr:hypothetical protein PPL_04370 [Heterostelium album PN500]EFA82676.1 hypothetical protein PPL_04370 [Heterostelium album PN500]|eukprot:XP_020434793.1 hypothetical protein PPL_04370 [Heterostelium album PN500]
MIYRPPNQIEINFNWYDFTQQQIFDRLSTSTHWLEDMSIKCVLSWNGRTSNICCDESR